MWNKKKNPNFDKFSEFCETFSMSNLVKDYTCFTKTHKSSTDFILTKKSTFVSTNQDNRNRYKWCSFLNINFHESADNTSTAKKGNVQRFLKI